MQGDETCEAMAQAVLIIIIMRPGLGRTKNPRGYAVLCTPDLPVYLFSIINISADTSLPRADCSIAGFPNFY